MFKSLDYTVYDIKHVYEIKMKHLWKTLFFFSFEKHQFFYKYILHFYN